MLSMIKPTELVTENDAYNYVVWHDVVIEGRTQLQIGNSKVDKESFWSWWTKYRNSEKSNRITMEEEMGRDKLENWRQILVQKFEEAKRYRRNENQKPHKD